MLFKDWTLKSLFVSMLSWPILGLAAVVAVPMAFLPLGRIYLYSALARRLPLESGPAHRLILAGQDDPPARRAQARGTRCHRSFLWAPSQKGLSPLRLQPQSQTFSAWANSIFIGVKPVSLWEPSQKGWFLDRPQLHHQ